MGYDMSERKVYPSLNGMYKFFGYKENNGTNGQRVSYLSAIIEFFPVAFS